MNHLHFWLLVILYRQLYGVKDSLVHCTVYINEKGFHESLVCIFLIFPPVSMSF
jgi:hypothetical protein